MESLGDWHWLALALVVFVVVPVVRFVAGRGGSLVVKRCFVSPTPREDGVYVEVIGRQSGLWGWLLAVLRIDPLVEMRIRYTRVEYFAGSLSGYNRVVLPIESISSVFFGFSRPWGTAFFWFFVCVAVAMGMRELGENAIFVALVFTGAFVATLVMVLGRARVIGLTEVTGDDYAMRLQRSLIEGQEIQQHQLEEISRIMLALLDAHKSDKARA